MTKIEQGWRAGGLLLHPSSLASPYGIGDLGPSAHDFVRFLQKAGVHYWQFLPLNPTSTGLGNSPYSSFSAFAGNTLLISPDFLVRDGWLNGDEAHRAQVPASNQINFPEVTATKKALLDLAFERAEGRLENHRDFQDFAWSNGTWLNDYSLFMAAKNHFGQQAWTSWPPELARREEKGLKHYGTVLTRSILREKFIQYLLFSQLAELKELMEASCLGLIGDAPIYVNHDSADVWSQPGLFELDHEGQPTTVAGVPPDYFAQEGQLWGNPLFRWENHRQSGYDWWKNRLWYLLGQFHWLRLDHFRAFAGFWAVPQGAPTAAGGYWMPGPGSELFQAAQGESGWLNIIAEDLGFITHDVTELRQKYHYPGMRVLQFAFGTQLGINTHAPFRIEPDNVVYPGTHDNNTTRGWYLQESTPLMRDQLSQLAGCQVTEVNAAQAMIRLAWLSGGALAVATIQDVLNLDQHSRLNTPGTPTGNWGWRLSPQDVDALSPQLAGELAELSALAGRDNCTHTNLLTY